jgi:predicted Zn-dependent protease
MTTSEPTPNETGAGTAPPARPRAVFFDGLSNRKHAVELRLTHDGIDIFEGGLGIAHWAYGGLRNAEGPPHLLRLASVSAMSLARLEVHDPVLQAEIRARCGGLIASPATARAHTVRIVGWSIAAVASIVLVVIYGVPVVAERLTPLIPPSFEQRMGDASEQQIKLMFGDRACTNPGGKAALSKLVNTLAQAGGLQVDLRSDALPSPLPNAFALAGGRIYLLDGLLQRADSVDELAGVLAHELGHAAHRDHVRSMIHNGGTSFLIGLLFGDVTGSSAAIFATRALLDSSYSRDAETSADAFAIGVMHKLGRSPKPLGDFLFRITGAEKNRSFSILASHPLTEERQAIMAGADRANTGPELLTAPEWQALKNICRGMRGQ